MSGTPLPEIIQGGMGVGVSGWRLAQAVCKAGQLGVVSGTGIDTVLVRRLQLGDPLGHVRRALAALPISGVADRILEAFFVEGGKDAQAPFAAKPVPSLEPSRRLLDLMVASNFVEVFLAREGHDRPVGINYLEKIQLPTLPSLYGAMLAGVGVIMIGAGIPRTIPAILDRLADGQAVELRVDVKGAEKDDVFATRFDPKSYAGDDWTALPRPSFVAIVSSSSLATMLVRRSTGRVDGLVVESAVAGGHNAPPRGAMQLSTEGEPIYGARDVADLAAIRELGVPFWLAGAQAEPEHLAAAQRAGAAGVQLGSAFAFCAESDLDEGIKSRVLTASRAGQVAIRTDPVASPTGFPFKVVRLAETLSEPEVAAARPRICDLGYLRQAYRLADGGVGWRCPAEPIEDWVQKGGDPSETEGRRCLCNALMANIGLGQMRAGVAEGMLVTSGDEAAEAARFLAEEATSYTAADVIRHVMGVDSAGPAGSDSNV